MERFLSSLENALKDRNWYAALFIGLALPDICGKLETPNNNVGDRYRAWVKKYLEPKYTSKIGAEKQKHIFLSADDCYALRCAYLHEGADDITEQKARKILESFLFIEPPNKGRVHCNQLNQKLQLQVDIFCNDIIAGVKQWIIDTKDIKEITESINNLITISQDHNMDENKLISTPHVVAFTDILGQSNRLKEVYKINWLKDEEGVSKILFPAYEEIIKLRRFVESINRSFDEQSKETQDTSKLSKEQKDLFLIAKKIKIYSKFFSDSIILNVPLKKENGIIPLKSVNSAISGIGWLMILALSEGIFFRTGIEIGPCIFNKEYDELYGSALSEAAACEKKAGFPRIILGNNLFKYLNEISNSEEESDPQNINKTLEKDLLETVKKDKCGFYYLDYLGKEFKSMLETDVDCSPLVKEAVQRIKFQLNAHKSDRKILKKYKKLKKYFKSKKNVWGDKIINF